MQSDLYSAGTPIITQLFQVSDEAAVRSWIRVSENLSQAHKGSAWHPGRRGTAFRGRQVSQREVDCSLSEQRSQQCSTKWRWRVCMRLAAAQRLRALRNAADLHTHRGPPPQRQQPAVHRDRAHSRVFATSLGISRSSASSTWRSRDPWTDEDWSRASRGSEQVSRLRTPCLSSLGCSSQHRRAAFPAIRRTATWPERQDWGSACADLHGCLMQKLK